MPVVKSKILIPGVKYQYINTQTRPTIVSYSNFLLMSIFFRNTIWNKTYVCSICLHAEYLCIRTNLKLLENICRHLLLLLLFLFPPFLLLISFFTDNTDSTMLLLNKTLSTLYCNLKSWIYSYLCNQCLSPLRLWVRIADMAKCTLYSIMR